MKNKTKNKQSTQSVKAEDNSFVVVEPENSHRINSTDYVLLYNSNGTPLLLPNAEGKLLIHQGNNLFSGEQQNHQDF